MDMNPKQSQTNKMNVMVMDDEPALTELLSDIAEMEGHEVITLNNPHQFEDIFSDHIHVLFIDLMMPGRDGIQILRYLAEIESVVTIIIISGFDKTVLEVASELGREHKLNIHSTLSKPFRVSHIKELLQSIQTNPQTNPHRKDLRKQDSDISVPMIKQALERGDFCFFYQPQFSLTDDSLIGYEALARWLHPEMGMISPVHFIPFMETHGLISELSLDLIQKGLKEFSSLKTNSHLSLSINISSNQLIDLDLPDILSDLIISNGLKPAQIIIEVTESGLIKNMRVSLDILARFRMMGFKLSIDDFGTGSAMYEHLQKLPVTELKIDQSFVAKALTDNKAKTIIEHTAALARGMGLTTVAEGVETREVEHFLKYSRIDVGQGYFYSKPLPFNEVTEAVW